MTDTVEAHSQGVRPGRARRLRIPGALPFLLPAAFFYVAFVVYPMATAVQWSFYEWNGLNNSSATWVGIQNYISIFTQDPVFWTAFRNSLIWVVLSLIVPTTLALVLAIALNEKIRGQSTFRATFYIPAIVSSIAVATIWRWMYNDNFGIINETLRGLGLDGLAQAWLANGDIALYAVFVASVWQVVGANMVLFLAGLQSVSKEQTEAARVDGAGRIGVFRNVTLPALQPTLFIVIVLTIINSLKVFDLIYGMTGGGPAQQTQVLALWSYSLSFSQHLFGNGSAVATVLLGITMLIIVPYLVWLLRGDRMG
jgi:raffinose/stachyose/melibiose transport system permease protein